MLVLKARSSLPPLWPPAGTITWESLKAVLPFGDTFNLVQLKGSTLRKAFEHSVHRYGKSYGEFLQVGGKWPPLRPGSFGFSVSQHWCTVS